MIQAVFKVPIRYEWQIEPSSFFRQAISTVVQASTMISTRKSCTFSGVLLTIVLRKLCGVIFRLSEGDLSD